ncbi:MAG: macro domain-containing protein [Vulcanimicrobiota bacterium]
MSAFGPILESGDYMDLLNIGPSCAGLIERIGEMATNAADLEAEFGELLNNGWRPALVACAALFGKCSEPLLEQLWEALDRGSWVAPQMAATLYLLDPNFTAKARRRLLAGCPPSRAERPITAEIHVLEGPAGIKSMSAKSRVCLMSLLAEDLKGRNWLYQNIDKADALHDILVEDAWDGSGRLVARWLHDVSQCLGIKTPHLPDDALTQLWPPETPDWLAADEVSEKFLQPLLRAGVSELVWRPDEKGTVVVAEPVGKVRFQRPYDSLLLKHLERHSSDGVYLTPLGNMRLDSGPPIRLVLEPRQIERITLSRERLEDSGARFLIHGASQDGRLKSGPGAALLALAGPELEYELMARLSQQSRELGQVVRTEAYGLRVRGVSYVLHVIALEAPRGCSQPEKLGEGLLDALRRSRGKVAVASMGSGGGGLDPARVARILVGAARQALEFFQGSIAFCLPNERDYQAFSKAMQS